MNRVLLWSGAPAPPRLDPLAAEPSKVQGGPPTSANCGAGLLRGRATRPCLFPLPACGGWIRRPPWPRPSFPGRNGWICTRPRLPSRPSSPSVVFSDPPQRLAGNIVSTVNLDCQLDLQKVANKARNAEYNPKRFAAVVMRIRDPKTTALVFASGKMVCTGAKSEDHSRLAARKYARIIQKLGFPARFTDFKIQNIVGSCDVKFPIRLEGLSMACGLFANYEPEIFPGLIYRMAEPKIVILVFVSGKIVLTGAKVREEIYTAFENIYPMLVQFRKRQRLIR